MPKNTAQRPSRDSESNALTIRPPRLALRLALRLAPLSEKGTPFGRSLPVWFTLWSNHPEEVCGRVRHTIQCCMCIACDKFNVCSLSKLYTIVWQNFQPFIQSLKPKKVVVMLHEWSWIVQVPTKKGPFNSLSIPKYHTDPKW